MTISIRPNPDIWTEEQFAQLQEIELAIRKLVSLINDQKVKSDNSTGGTGSAGAGNQYISLTLPNGTSYKVLHDGSL